MRDYNGRLVYYLFFASNNSTGHLKMKEAMWKVDPKGDFTFSDSTPNQTLLFNLNPSMVPLAVDISAKFKGEAQIPVKRVETLRPRQHRLLAKAHVGSFETARIGTGGTEGCRNEDRWQEAPWQDVPE
jgi:hypothetical protein